MGDLDGGVIGLYVRVGHERPPSKGCSDKTCESGRSLPAGPRRTTRLREPAVMGSIHTWPELARCVSASKFDPAAFLGISLILFKLLDFVSTGHRTPCGGPRSCAT